MTETLQDTDSYILLNWRTRPTRCRAGMCSTWRWWSTSRRCRTRHVEGVVFSRGQVVPAINLRLRFWFCESTLHIEVAPDCRASGSNDVSA